MSADYSTEYYSKLTRGSRSSADIVVPLVIDLIRPSSVVDLGCGTGAWLAAFESHGVSDVFGVDGSELDSRQLEIDTDNFLRADLTQPLAMNRRFDLALSLEVAEHLQPEAAQLFVDTLTKLAPAVLFSAAIPGQGGEHHLNEQWPAYWIKQFATHDFAAFDPFRRPLWQRHEIEWWYAQNLLLFAHRNSPAYAKLEPASEVLPLVHPRNFDQLVWRNRVLEFAVELASVVPQGEQIILADENRFGGLPLPSRRIRPFIEREGAYLGPPATDHEAIRELDRMKQEGSRYFAVGWPAFWWLEYYRMFAAHLEHRYPIVLKDDRLVVYHLER